VQLLKSIPTHPRLRCFPPLEQLTNCLQEPGREQQAMRTRMVQARPSWMWMYSSPSVTLQAIRLHWTVGSTPCLLLAAEGRLTAIVVRMLCLAIEALRMLTAMRLMKGKKPLTLPMATELSMPLAERCSLVVEQSLLGATLRWFLKRQTMNPKDRFVVGGAGDMPFFN